MGQLFIKYIYCTKRLVGLPVYKKTHCMFYRLFYSFVFNVLLYSYVIFLLHMFINRQCMNI